MMLLRTTQGLMFKNIMESMKDNLNDCNIICRPEGMVSTGLDAAHISLAHFKLYGEGVEEYRCDGTYTLGINTQYFHRYIKNLSRHDMLELRYEEKDPDNLRITINSPESGPRRVSMRLLHMESDDLTDMPEHEYSMILTMPSIELQQIVREMLPNGENLRISCRTQRNGDRQVTFTTSGEAGDMSYDLNLGQEDMDVEDFDDVDMQFSLKYMWSFVRASPLSPQVKLYLKQDQPISLKYEMGSMGKHSLGEIIFLMAPKMEDEPFFPPNQDPPPQVLAEAGPTHAEQKPAPKRRKTTKSPEPPHSPEASIGAWHEDDPEAGQAELEWD